MTNTTTTTTTTAVNPSEVGWQFVPQYYTFVNKQPHRLHCFYTKASTFIHGTEGEDGKPCYGQQWAEIHSKIQSIGFQDCKVFIHSVDAQSSANGGIIIQVIGEMSNNGEPWRKFVQTFFLAEQPNGYFVLNDIFRFLKEEAVDDDQEFESQVAQEQPAASVQETVAPPAPATPAPPPPAEPELEPEPIAPSPAPPAPVEEAPAPAPEPAPQPQPNGIHEQKPEPTPEPEPVAAPTAPEPVATASPPPVSPVAAPQALAPSPAPVAVPAPQQPPQQPAPAPLPAPAPPAEQPQPQPAAPPKPKSWASLAAASSAKWGSIAQESRGITEVPVSTVSSAPSSGPQTPAPHARPGQQSQAVQAALAVNTPAVFVKGVVENVSDSALRNVLQRFGPIKDFEIVRSRACAFLEYNTVESARRAIIASLPVNQGGEGGLRIGNPQDSHAPRISVETRKERGDRPPPRGPPVNGGDNRRGNFRGRGAPGGGRGRGAGPQK